MSGYSLLCASHGSRGSQGSRDGIYTEANGEARSAERPQGSRASQESRGSQGSRGLHQGQRRLTGVTGVSRHTGAAEVTGVAEGYRKRLGGTAGPLRQVTGSQPATLLPRPTHTADTGLELTFAPVSLRSPPLGGHWALGFYDTVPVQARSFNSTAYRNSYM